MAADSRWKWVVFSGLTRSEQRVLLFLVGIMAAGLVYNEFRGGSRDQTLVLHRGALQAAPSSSAERLSSSTLTRTDPLNGAAATDPSGLLDINTASAEALEQLPKIGPATAAAIIRYRVAKGPFRRIEDLKEVGGIGPKTLEVIRPYLKPPAAPATPSPLAARSAAPNAAAVAPNPTPARLPPAGPTPGPPLININTADVDALCTLDGVGPALAQRIIDYRRRQGPFRSVGDLEKIRGIGPVVVRENRDRMTVGR
jgi:competence protein ComEA